MSRIILAERSIERLSFEELIRRIKESESDPGPR